MCICGDATIGISARAADAMMCTHGAVEDFVSSTIAPALRATDVDLAEALRASRVRVAACFFFDAELAVEEQAHPQEIDLRFR
jgi:hypothetical protein